MKRRDFFKTAGLITAGAVVSPSMLAKGSENASEEYAPGNLNDRFPVKSLKADVNRAISVVIIGIGNRGSVYARYAKKYPEAMKIAGIVDNNVQRLVRYGKEHNDRFIPSRCSLRNMHHSVRNASQIHVTRTRKKSI